MGKGPYSEIQNLEIRIKQKEEEIHRLKEKLADMYKFCDDPRAHQILCNSKKVFSKFDFPKTKIKRRKYVINEEN